MCKFCDEPKPNGDWEPCCYYGNGMCEAALRDKDFSMCVHCGAEMFKEDGIWYHHSQKEIPINERYMEHTQQQLRDY